ncbi:hypothetical protein ACFX12_038430 [Malus domestica]
MSSSSHKIDDGVSPLYRQGASLSKVGYFKAAHFKISSNDSFRDFHEAYRHVISSRVCVKRAKDNSSASHVVGLGKPSNFTPSTLCWDLLFPCHVSSKICFAP